MNFFTSLVSHPTLIRSYGLFIEIGVTLSSCPTNIHLSLPSIVQLFLTLCLSCLSLYAISCLNGVKSSVMNELGLLRWNSGFLSFWFSVV